MAGPSKTWRGTYGNLKFIIEYKTWAWLISVAVGAAVGAAVGFTIAEHWDLIVQIGGGNGS